jgi:hypothetical protein
MSSIKIGFAVWNLNDTEKETLHKIIKYFSSLLKPKTSFEIFDVKYNDVETTDYILCFGSRAAVYREEGVPSWNFQPLKKLENKPDNVNSRKDFVAVLEEIAAVINAEQKKTILKVKVEDDVTVGTKDCTFNITEQEIDYLKKLQSLLDGSEIFIQKDDVKIQIGRKKKRHGKFRYFIKEAKRHTGVL